MLAHCCDLLGQLNLRLIRFRFYIHVMGMGVCRS